MDSGGAHPNPKAHYQPVRTATGQWRYPNPRGYAKALKALIRRQRAQARRTPGSRGWREAQRRIDRAHRRAKGLRDNAHHHVSRALVRKYHTLGIETLNVSGMIRAGPQSKALADAGMSGLLHPGPLQGPVVRYTDRGSRPVVSRQPRPAPSAER